jgi:hypothetical protein
MAGDVIVTTHISPRSPVLPHHPVPLMDGPVHTLTMLRQQVDERMDAILCVDATKGNRIIKTAGFAISPTILDGYILPPSDDLLTLMSNVTGKQPAVFAVTTQDLTPDWNGISHLNGILQPSLLTHAPLVGVAITAETVIAGAAPGANHPFSLEQAARFCVEVARGFGEQRCSFHDPAEFARLRTLYGSLEHMKAFSDPDAD